MRSILEQIPKTKGSSFRLLINPNLQDFYYWHFHPEVELVYIEGVDGSRHIGNHKSNFTNGDLAFIGPYIPHLNFDYGIKEPCYKIVLQFNENLLDGFDHGVHELKSIKKLLSDSRHGIVFSEELKLKVGPMMKNLNNLKGFNFFNHVLTILNHLADSTSYELVHKLPYQNQFYEKQEDKIKEVLAYIEANFHQKISINELAKISNYSEGAFCRYFKKMTKLSFTTFVNNYRIDMSKRMLASGKNVTEAAYSCGFESISYFNRVFKRIVGMGPREWKKNN